MNRTVFIVVLLRKVDPDSKDRIAYCIWLLLRFTRGTQHQYPGNRWILSFMIYTLGRVNRIRTLSFDGRFSIHIKTGEKYLFQLYEIGKPGLVLRLYVVKGVV